MDSNTATASATSTSATPRFTVSQQLQNLAAANRSSLLDSLGANKSPADLFGVEVNSNFATQSMLMHAVSSELTPLISNPSLLGKVVDYRVNEKAQRDTERRSDKEVEKPNIYDPMARQAAMRAKYSKLFADFVSPSGGTFDASA